MPFAVPSVGAGYPAAVHPAAMPSGDTCPDSTPCPAAMPSSNAQRAVKHKAGRNLKKVSARFGELVEVVGTEFVDVNGIQLGGILNHYGKHSAVSAGVSDEIIALDSAGEGDVGGILPLAFLAEEIELVAYNAHNLAL